MVGKTGRTIQVVAVVLMSIFPWTATKAQTGGGDSLESQLAAKYKLAKTASDSNGLSVIDPGTLLTVKKGGIRSIPPEVSVFVPTEVKDGQVIVKDQTGANVGKKLGGFILKQKGLSDPTGATSTDTKFLTVGEKVYPIKIDVNRKDSKVSMQIIECDSCNNVQDASSRKAQVVFDFPAGYLNSADGGQVSDVINQILEIDAGGGDQQQQAQDQQGQQGDQQAAEQPAAEQAAPQPAPTIKLGMTPEEVTAAFGEPQKKVDLGTKLIYYYKDMKVTFVKGKVTDVQ